MLKYLLVFLTADLTRASPSPESTCPNTESDPGFCFVVSPKGRGTLSIFFSCVLTLSFCVLVSIQPNIQSNPTYARRFRQKALYAAVAILAPEVILAIAFNEWRAARHFRRQWNEFHTKTNQQYPEPRSSTTPDKSDLNMSVAFFTVMGGFKLGALDSPSGDDNLHLERTISPEGIILLLRKGLLSWPSIEGLLDKIEHRRKPDKVARLLVCAQALWMIIQCCLRTAGGLPVTVLEMSVLGHLLCATATYGFWWKKPHHAVNGVSLDSHLAESSRIVLSIMDEALGAAASALLPGPPKSVEVGTAALGDVVVRRVVEGVGAGTDSNMTGHVRQISEAYPQVFQQVITAGCGAGEGAVIPHESGLRNALPGVGLVKPPDSNPVRDGQEGRLYMCKPDVSVDNKRALCLACAACGDTSLTPPSHNLTTKTTEILRASERHDKLVCPLGGDTKSYPLRPVFPPGSTSLPSPLDLAQPPILWTLVPLSLLFGGFYATIWNNYFPTSIECLLWRVSCIVIGFPGLGPVAVMVTSRIFGGSSEKLRYVMVGILDAVKSEFRYILLFSLIGGSILAWVSGYINTHDLPMKLRVNALSYVSMGTAMVVWAMVIFWVFLQFKKRYAYGSHRFLLAKTRLVGCLLGGLVYIATSVMILAYILARVFLFAEAFLSLRRLPEGSYETVEWVDLVPHL